MASVKQLKKKINQQSFKIVKFTLEGGNQNTNSDKLLSILADVKQFQQISRLRINQSRNMVEVERRAELKTVAEQLKDKETYFIKAISILL